MCRQFNSAPRHMYTVYIIQNPQGILYKGHTNNLERRIREHNISNSRFSRYTKNKGPWKLIYQECFSTRKEAMKREKYFKTGKGREELIALKSKNKNAAEVSAAAEKD